MKKITKITALIMATILMAFTFAACGETSTPDTKEEAAARQTKKYSVTFCANEVPNFAAEKVVKGAMVYDSVNDEDLGMVSDVLCEGSVSYASDAGKFIMSEKMGFNSLIVTSTVEASEAVEGWYIGDTLYGIGHTAPLHIGNVEVELTIRSFEVID